jgi:hypothetical protein
MTRVRAWAARALVSLASRLIGAPLAGGVSIELEEEDDDDLPMPAGHPVVVRSPRAEEMILEGARRAPRQKPEPEAPLAGSLQDRINRRDL